MSVNAQVILPVFFNVDSELAKISLADESGSALHEAFRVGERVALDREKHADNEALKSVIVEIFECLLNVKRSGGLFAVTIHHSVKGIEERA